MAKVKVVLHRPLKLGKDLLPKSAKPVEVDDALLKGKWAETLIKEGAIVLVPDEKAAAPAPAAKAGK